MVTTLLSILKSPFVRARVDTVTQSEPAVPPWQFRVFWILCVIGIVERLFGAYYSNLGMAHCDEHQQYLEQAFRHAYGFGETYWEQWRGMRHPFYTESLAVLIHGMDWLGLQQPFVQAMILRFLMATLIFALTSCFAYGWLCQGRTVAALGLMFFQVASSEVVYIQVRLLSENSMVIFLLLGLLLERRRPLLTGICWMLMFAVRFQSAFLIMGFYSGSMFQALYRWRTERNTGLTLGEAFRPLLHLTAGLLLGALLIGYMDYVFFGRWFHSPLENVKANLIEGLSRNFCVSPPSYYLVWGSVSLLLSCGLIAVLLLFGLPAVPRLYWASLIFVLGHSAIAHKEARFMWPLLPLGLIMMAAGLERLYWFCQPQLRRPLWALVILSFLIPSLLFLPAIEWSFAPYRDSSMALAWLSRQQDVSGVAVVGVSRAHSGNRFYLRREVTLIYDEAEDFYGLVNDLTVKPDYWLVHADALESIRERAWEEVAQFGELVLFRVRSDKDSRRIASARE
jgi:hypothetical protein